MSGAVVIKGDSEENIVTGTVNEMTLGEKTDIIVGGFGVCCVGPWVDLSPFFKAEIFGFKLEVCVAEYHATGPQWHYTQAQTHVINGDETVTVTGNQTHDISGAATHTTTGISIHIYKSNLSENVSGNKYETVNGNKYERVDGDVYHFHDSYTKVSAAFDLTIYNNAQNPTEQIGMVEGDSHELALAHNLEILATVGPFGGVAQTSLKLVPASATLGSTEVNIHGSIINLGQPNAPLPIITNLPAILAAAAAAAAAQAAAEAATAELFDVLPGYIE